MMTEKTLQVLKNYATINPNIVIENGNVVKTISEARAIVSKSSVDVDFPLTFGIFDLSNFLNVLSLVESPTLDFKNDYVEIKDQTGRTSIKYHYSDPEVLTSPKEEVIMESSDVEFLLDRDTLSKIRRASSVLGHQELHVTNNNGDIYLVVVDGSDKTSNAYTVAVNGSSRQDVNFDLVFNINHLKMIDGDYKVKVSSKLISHFINTNGNLEYWVALDKSSKYGE